jgi:hypothetical protein
VDLVPEPSGKTCQCHKHTDAKSPTAQKWYRQA